MPGPGHPGHFPKPPGWVDRPGGGPAAPRPSTSADRPTGPDPQGAPPAGSPRPSAGAPPAGASPEGHPSGSSDVGPQSDGSTKAGGTSRAADAAARVAEMLKEDGDEEEAAAGEQAVEEAAEAVADDIEDLGSVVAARDEYLDSLRRLQADFENYKKRIQRQQADLQDRAAEALVEKLLPALDNFDLALAHADGDAVLEPVYRSLLTVLATAGLERLDPAGQPFDPNEHDAVLHEQAEDSAAPEVIEVLRAGYRWKGRVLRPAMVKVKG